jgi:hypothetical protein
MRPRGGRRRIGDRYGAGVIDPERECAMVKDPDLTAIIYHLDNIGNRVGEIVALMDI